MVYLGKICLLITFSVGDISFNSGDSYFGANLTNAVRSGAVREERVTDMAMRIVAAWYKVSLRTFISRLRSILIFFGTKKVGPRRIIP